MPPGVHGRLSRTRTPASCSSPPRRAGSSPTWAVGHHAGGGSHGSLVAGDSFVPVVTVGLRAELHRITDVAPAVLAHFGVAVPKSMEALAGVG